MIESLLSTPATDMLERTLSFTEQRHQLILSNLANADTPGYLQQDVSVGDFQKSLSNALQKQNTSNASSLNPENTDTVSFSTTSLMLQPQPVLDAQPFHDKGARSMESIMGQLADNAEAHNMAASFLRSRYDWLQKAISMRA